MKLMAPLPKDAGNSQHVVTPCAGPLLGQVVKIELEITGEFFRVDYKLPIRPRRNGHIRGEANGGRHDEAVVVIGVFSDQVDASGRAEDSRRNAEKFFEVLLETAYLPRRHARIPMQNGSC